MPALKNPWTKDQEISYLDCSIKESPYVFSQKGKIIFYSDKFSLEEYQNGKSGEFIIRNREDEKVIGYLFAYTFSYREIKIEKGILIDNPFIEKKYRGMGLSLWAYENLFSYYNLPLVSSQTQTISIFRSVWIPLSERKRVSAHNSVTGENIFPWSKKDMSVTHLNNGEDWLLVYR